MKRKRFTEEQIITILEVHEAGVLLAETMFKKVALKGALGRNR